MVTGKRRGSWPNVYAGSWWVSRWILRGKKKTAAATTATTTGTTTLKYIINDGGDHRGRSHAPVERITARADGEKMKLVWKKERTGKNERKSKRKTRWRWWVVVKKDIAHTRTHAACGCSSWRQHRRFVSGASAGRQRSVFWGGQGGVASGWAGEWAGGWERGSIHHAYMCGLGLKKHQVVVVAVARVGYLDSLQITGRFRLRCGPLRTPSCGEFAGGSGPAVRSSPAGPDRWRCSPVCVCGKETWVCTWVRKGFCWGRS